MKYGKIICGTLHVPQNYPCIIMHEGQRINNPTEDDFKAAGYLPIEESEPEEVEGKVSVATYDVNDKGTKIVQSWIYEDIPAQQPEID